MMKKTLTIAVAVFLCASTVIPYAVPVHERITEAAAAKAFANVNLAQRLGVSATVRINGRTLNQWVMNGAVAEDDIYPWQSMPPARSIHHFYDPVHDQPLTMGQLPGCTTLIGVPGVLSIRSIQANRWALQPQLLNNWGLTDARKHERAAILGPNPGTRQVHVKSLFLSLGHMVHLVQDMAQPEHTRNDQHLLGLGAETASFYEEWTKQNLVGSSAIFGADAYFDGYDTVALPSFNDYFHTADGKGLADYSNRNFVTQDTNYDDELSLLKCFHYDEPKIAYATPRVETVREQVRDAQGVLYCCEDVLETIFNYHPDDRYRPTPTDADAYHTVLSSLDFDTRNYDTTRDVYALAPTSYQTRAALLVPRAVGYSEGMIEHFFRGVLDAQWQRNGSYYELTLTNRSDDYLYRDAKISIAYRADPAYFGRTNSDDLWLFADDVPIEELAPSFDGLAPGQSVRIDLVNVGGLQGSDSLLDFERRVVVEGKLGTETGALMTTVSGPQVASGFRVHMKVTPPLATTSFSAFGYDSNYNFMNIYVDQGVVLAQNGITADLSGIANGEVEFVYSATPILGGGHVVPYYTTSDHVVEIEVTNGATTIYSFACPPGVSGCGWSYFP